MSTAQPAPLQIPKTGDLDFLSLGALIHRFDPGIVPFHKATTFQVHVSGGEFNCAANLSDCFRLKTGIATAMVDYPIGDLIAERVQAMGVKPFYKMFKHDGAWGPNMAAVYSDRGYGIRPPVVFYNRSNEAATLLKPGDFDWAGIFGKGVRWFHSGGLFTALGEGTDEVIIEAMQAAKKAGAVVSFDLNYREKLWNARGGNEKAQDVFRKIVQYVDVLVGNEEDLQRALGIKGPAVGHAKSGLDPAAFFAMIDDVTKAFPQIKVVATTLREVHSTNRHTWGAVAWIEGKSYVAPVCELEVYDRVGGGDAFASGLFFGLLTGEPHEECVKLGWAHGALATTFPGDTTMARLSHVRAFAKGGSARIQR
jgi:2-dehydro-3-deoxygluconokinase